MLGRRNSTVVRKTSHKIKVKRYIHNSATSLFHFILPNDSLITQIIFYKEGVNDDTSITVDFLRETDPIGTYESISNYLSSINLYIKDGGIISCRINSPILNKLELFYTA